MSAPTWRRRCAGQAISALRFVMILLRSSGSAWAKLAAYLEPADERPLQGAAPTVRHAAIRRC